ncbi:MAG: protease modulator HflK [Planctomycetes bacterium]|nr:protease modulator HflK [Planctomycetota bacterium]
MTRAFLYIFAALLAWLATGFYVVRGNETAVVRRCGRLVRAGEGRPLLVSSGLHYDLPWPFSQVDRTNLSEVRTLTIGRIDLDDGGEFLQVVDPSSRSRFLTGDKNLLNLQLNVQYRVSPAGVDRWLYASESNEARLRALVESAAAELVSQSGVDFVHPLGLGELRRLLTLRVQHLVDEQNLGIAVDEVTIAGVSPPVQVKSDFLDVANARADKEKYIHAAEAFAEEQLQAAQARAQETLDTARIEHEQLVTNARGRSDRFRKLIAQLRHEASLGGRSYEDARGMALRREYLSTMEDVLQDVAGKVFLDSGQPVDLTIFRDPKE